MPRHSIWERITREINGNSTVSVGIPESFLRRSVREEAGGGTVTVHVPREDAEELLHSLMGALEDGEPTLDDLEGDIGSDEEFGLPGGEDGEGGPPEFSAQVGDEEGDDDDSDSDDSDDDGDDSDDDSDDDDDDDVEEDAEPSYGRPNPRPGTAFGETRRRRGRLLF